MVIFLFKWIWHPTWEYVQELNTIKKCLSKLAKYYKYFSKHGPKTETKIKTNTCFDTVVKNLHKFSQLSPLFSL